MSVAGLFSLAGRTALVTGGSRGLGLQIAQALGQAGARLLVSARKADGLAEAVESLRTLGIDASGLTVDVGDPQALQAFAAAALTELGHVDILVNNAGATWAAPAESHPLEAWNKLVNVNMTGVFVLTQIIGRDSMIPRGYGRILNVASIAGLRGNPPGTNTTIAYNATKAGLINFTRALAGEWGPYGITVNALAPGFFPTRMTRGALDRFADQIKAITPLHRLGDEHDLQGASLLFCSDAGKHITGQVLAIDGGVSAV